MVPLISNGSCRKREAKAAVSIEMGKLKAHGNKGKSEHASSFFCLIL